MQASDRPLRPRRSDGGFTLVELLVAMAMLVAVLGIAMPVVVQALQIEPRISQRAAQIGKARALAERVTRELRQGYAVDSAGSSALSFRTYTRRVTCGGNTVPDPSAPAIQCQVTYGCSGGTCTRTEADPASPTGGTTTALVEGLLSDAVFTYLPSASDPGYVEIKFVLPAEDGEDAITLEDGIDLRNVTE